MTNALFIQVGDTVVNLSLCERIVLEDDTLSFFAGGNSHDIAYQTDEAAAEALGRVRQLLESRSLVLGVVP